MRGPPHILRAYGAPPGVPSLAFFRRHAHHPILERTRTRCLAVFRARGCLAPLPSRLPGRPMQAAGVPSAWSQSLPFSTARPRRWCDAGRRRRPVAATRRPAFRDGFGNRATNEIQTLIPSEILSGSDPVWISEGGWVEGWGRAKPPMSFGCATAPPFARDPLARRQPRRGSDRSDRREPVLGDREDRKRRAADRVGGGGSGSRGTGSVRTRTRTRTRGI